MTSPDIPPRAVAAALAARDESQSLTDEGLTRDMLAAAKPHLAPATPAGVIHIEGTKLSEAEAEELAGRWKAAWHEGKYKILPDDTEARIAEAAAAERERCAQLIIPALVKAFGPHKTYSPAQRGYVPDGDDAATGTMVTFIASDGDPALRSLTYGEIADAIADLLRHGGEGGGT